MQYYISCSSKESCNKYQHLISHLLLVLSLIILSLKINPLLFRRKTIVNEEKSFESLFNIKKLLSINLVLDLCFKACHYSFNIFCIQFRL